MSKIEQIADMILNYMAKEAEGWVSSLPKSLYRKFISPLSAIEKHKLDKLLREEYNIKLKDVR